MEERTLRLLTLTHLSGLGARRLATLIRMDGVDDLYQSPRRFLERLGEDAVQGLESGALRRRADEIAKQAESLGQEVISLGSAGYPAALAEIYDPPAVLFVKGTTEDGRRRVAVVGARGATPAGRAFAREIARGLAAHGVEVVSGLARGIDGAAHEGALAGKGTTLAVLGSSADIIYPAEHLDLARRIEGLGAVLSEFPPGTRPAPTHFPKRNRIIVGLSEAVVIVEAGARSGALITARLALDEGRDVLAAPGRPSDPLAFGPNLMIRDGATLIRGVEDVLEHLGFELAAPKELSSPPDKILDCLSRGVTKSIDQIAVDTGLAPPFLMARMSELELAGRVLRLPGTLFRAASPA